MFNIRALALTCGIFWSVSVLLFALLAMQTGLAITFVNMLSEVYLGYAPTFQGALIGFVWGLLDGLICGAIFGWLYNALAR